MKKSSILAGVMSCAVMSVALLGSIAAEETAEVAAFVTQSTGEGAKLYEYQGCVNCHGEDGKSPVADIVPKLAGKDSVYLLEQMEAIISGERSGDTTAAIMMHQQYYTEEAANEACDVAPTQAELKQIAGWLATR